VKRVIFSLYIDIPEDELDYQPPYHNDTISKTIRTKEKLKEYYAWLKSMQQRYAESIGIDYKLFEYDKKYIEYKNMFNKKYPEITSYNIVNFYKIHLMYEMSKHYDEILYLDFDAIPISNRNFFDYWDVTKNGVAIFRNARHVDRIDNQLYRSQERYERKGKAFSIRSPTAKYWNARALLIDQNMSGSNDVYNTGIVGISAKDLDKLNYFEDFTSLLNLMTELKNDSDGMWPEYLRDMFGWDNETIWSFRMNANGVGVQWLDEKWHHFMDKWSYIPKETNLVHVINKDFQYVKEWYEKNNF
jgi:hypothetical protein